MSFIMIRILFKKVAVFARAHKMISGVILTVLLVGGYTGYKKATNTSGETRYVLGVVSKGTIVAAVSASGQVSALNQIDVKAKASGELVWVGTKAGNSVGIGQSLASIDSTTAKQNVVDAEASLALLKLQYQKDTAQAPIDYVGGHLPQKYSIRWA